MALCAGRLALPGEQADRVRSVTDTNKCIGDDTKAASRQSLNCIKNKKITKYGEKQFLTIFMADGIRTPCNVARS